MFYQYGVNNSSALPFRQYLGAGLTAFGLVPPRPEDSMGTGGALSWLNQTSFNRETEFMLQFYYQAKIVNSLYLEPAFSYIPTPGAGTNLNPAWAGTMRAIFLF
jgi:porin